MDDEEDEPCNKPLRRKRRSMGSKFIDEEEEVDVDDHDEDDS